MIRIGTRKSKLALIQTELVKAQILKYFPDEKIEIVHVVTHGDKVLDKPLGEIGGKGVFTKEIEEKLLDKTIDIAVHSAKDVPMELADGLCLGAVLLRDDNRDVILKRKETGKIGAGSIIGTSSLRREIQIKQIYPDATIKSLRGNVGTRIDKLKSGEYDAIILAAAGLKRLGLDNDKELDYIYPDEEKFISAAGQGILAIECRNGDLKDVMAALDDRKARICLEAEREFLKCLDGSCNAPCGAHCTVDEHGFNFRGMYAYDGKTPKYAVINEKPDGQWGKISKPVNADNTDLKFAISLAKRLVDVLKSDAKNTDIKNENGNTKCCVNFKSDNGNTDKKDIDINTKKDELKKSFTGNKGMVSLVGAGPGKRDYLSIEALRCIKKADVIVYDALISPSILNEAKMDAELIYVGKRADTIYKKQPEINELLVNLALSGKYVVRLKGGDPFIFGRGGEEALALKKAGIRYEIVSGISSSYSVPASAGIPVTHRGAASSVHIITGHEHPAKPSEALDFSVIAKEEGTLVFLMGLRSLGNICEKLIKNGKNGETPVAVISKGMTAKQRSVYGNLLTIKDEVRKNNIEAPAIIVVGDVVGVGKQICEWQSKNEKKVLSGKRILVTGSRNMADSLEKEFEQYGGETIAISLVETIPDYSDCDDIFNNLEKYSWFIFTSANGVNIFFDRLRNLRVDIRKLANIRFAVVGTSTKKALEKYGLYADFIPSKFKSKILAEELSKELTDKDKILIVRGKQGKNFIEDKFSEMSVEFDKICIYETIQDERRADEVKRICPDVDYIVVTSGSGARALRDMAGCEHDNIVAIGPVTKRDCDEAGLRVKLVAEEFDARGIVDVIVRDVEKQG